MYIDDYREKLSLLAHRITGKFMTDGKIKSFEERRIPGGIKFEVHFTDDGMYLDVEVKIVKEQENDRSYITSRSINGTTFYVPSSRSHPELFSC